MPIASVVECDVGGTARAPIIQLRAATASQARCKAVNPAVYGSCARAASTASQNRVGCQLPIWMTRPSRR